MPLWTLTEAVTLVQEIEPQVRASGYHTLLGGSVLHKGSSEKDLDLFFSPMLPRVLDSEVKLTNLLTQYFGALMSANEDYDAERAEGRRPFKILKGKIGDRRVDLFID